MEAALFHVEQFVFNELGSFLSTDSVVLRRVSAQFLSFKICRFR
jgi:hypothetical protein